MLCKQKTCVPKILGCPALNLCSVNWALVSGTVVPSVSEARNLRKFLSFEAKTLVQALVISRLECYNSNLYVILAMHTNKLQHVQNAAAGLLTNMPRYSHITLVMVDLHWLPVKFRIIFKVILFTSKAV